MECLIANKLLPVKEQDIKRSLLECSEACSCQLEIMATRLESTQCVDCNKSTSADSIHLNCGKHRICVTCFISRGRCKECVDAKKCAICVHVSAGRSQLSPQSPPAAKPGIWIYLDNSNIWIEGKRLASKKNGFETVEDHRLRIEFGKMSEVIRNGRRVEKFFLYGSKPPPNDTLWNNCEKQGWVVDIKERSHCTGKEKGVDSQLIVDVTRRVCETPEDERSTIVIVTGDADHTPAVEVVQEKGWPLEVYSWQHSLATKMGVLTSKENSKFIALDLYMEKITYINRVFTNRHEKSFGIVLKMRPGIFQNGEPPEEWYLEVERKAKWPIRYCWLEEHDHFLLEFKGYDYHKKINDMKKFTDAIKMNPFLYVEHVQTYQEYQSDKRSECSEVSVKDLQTSDEKSSSDSEWQEVRHKRKPKRAHHQMEVQEQKRKKQRHN